MLDIPKAAVRAHASPWFRSVELLITSGRSVCTGLVMSTPQPGEESSPSLQLSYEDAQTLMDDLWASGLRPSEGSGSAGAMRATERHLEDMRRLVFESTKPPT